MADIVEVAPVNGKLPFTKTFYDDNGDSLTIDALELAAINGTAPDLGNETPGWLVNNYTTSYRDTVEGPNSSRRYIDIDFDIPVDADLYPAEHAPQGSIYTILVRVTDGIHTSEVTFDLANGISRLRDSGDALLHVSARLEDPVNHGTSPAPTDFSSYARTLSRYGTPTLLGNLRGYPAWDLANQNIYLSAANNPLSSDPKREYYIPIVFFIEHNSSIEYFFGINKGAADGSLYMYVRYLDYVGAIYAGGSSNSISLGSSINSGNYIWLMEIFKRADETVEILINIDHASQSIPIAGASFDAGDIGMSVKYHAVDGDYSQFYEWLIYDGIPTADNLTSIRRRFKTLYPELPYNV